MTQINVIAKSLKELGHPVRLRIFKRLVRAGFQGLTVGCLQKELSIPGSTLSHHLSCLMLAGLLTQRREGRLLYCVSNYDKLEKVIHFLKAECCADQSNS
ncbi:MAG: metalloregulator ArsR/SmtB family transcription factor [Endozoicomonas sp. (ex Botrylloides leachii)]|nr:metalloregulator ArsR/SmtB family transcription factor [Endozoicomonas sp. (ex Botrylloides leachii)]